LNDENIFDIDSVSNVLFLRGDVDKIFRSCQKHTSLITISLTVLWPPCISFPVCNKSKVKLMHSSSQIEHNRKLVLTHTQDTTVFSPIYIFV
jgi:hypothetical protein